MSNLDRRYGTDSKPQSMLGRPGLLQIGRGTTGREVRYPNEPRMVTAAGANARDAAQAAADLAKIKANAADRAAGVSTPGVSTQDIATAAQSVAVNNAASNVEVAPTPTPETPASPVNNVAAPTQVSRDLMTHKGNTQGNIWARPTSLSPRARMGVNSDESRLSPEINTALGNVGNALAQAGNVLGGIAKGTVNALSSAFIHADELSGTGNANILSPKTMTALGFSQESVANAVKKEEAFDALNIPDAADVAGYVTKSVDQWSQTWVPAPASQVAKKTAEVSNALGEAIPGIVVGAITGGVGGAVIGGTVAGRLVGASNAFTKEYVASGKNYYQALLAGGIEYAAEAAGAKLFSGASDALVDNLISPIGKGVASLGGNVVSEGLEEVISGATHAMLTGTQYTAEQARGDMLIGSLVGGAAGAISPAIQEAASLIPTSSGNTSSKATTTTPGTSNFAPPVALSDSPNYTKGTSNGVELPTITDTDIANANLSPLPAGNEAPIYTSMADMPAITGEVNIEPLPAGNEWTPIPAPDMPEFMVSDPDVSPFFSPGDGTDYRETRGLPVDRVDDASPSTVPDTTPPELPDMTPDERLLADTLAEVDASVESADSNTDARPDEYTPPVQTAMNEPQLQPETETQEQRPGAVATMEPPTIEELDLPTTEIDLTTTDANLGGRLGNLELLEEADALIQQPEVDDQAQTVEPEVRTESTTDVSIEAQPAGNDWVPDSVGIQELALSEEPAIASDAESVEPELQTLTEAEIRRELATGAQVQTEVEPEPELALEVMPALSAATGVQTHTQAATATQTETELETRTGIEIETATETQPQPETETQTQPQTEIGTRLDVMTDWARRREQIPQHNAGLFASPGSQGRIYDTQGYDRTFGGLSSG